MNKLITNVLQPIMRGKKTTLFGLAFAFSVFSVGSGLVHTNMASATSYGSISCASGQSNVYWDNTNSLLYRPGQFCLMDFYGIHKAVFQGDGNFVVYNSGHPLWNSQTNGMVGTYGYLLLQSDGNIVIYNANNQAVWNSRTNGRAGADRDLNMGTNGDLTLNSNGVVWHTNTAGR